MTPPTPSGPLRVLGIDPGLADVGWGAIDSPRDGAAARLVDYGVIQTAAGDSLAARLDQIYQRLSGLIERVKPDVVAIEQLFFAKNVKTAMVVAHGRAACILATARGGVSVCEYTPLEIKQALTGHGRASKEQVQRMVRVVLRLTEIPRPDHAADALAAALCHVHSLPLREKIDRARGKLAAAGAKAAAAVNGPDEMDPRKLLLAQQRRRRGRR